RRRSTRRYRHLLGAPPPPTVILTKEGSVRGQDSQSRMPRDTESHLPPATRLYAPRWAHVTALTPRARTPGGSRYKRGPRPPRPAYTCGRSRPTPTLSPRRRSPARLGGAR